jgi:hypothetical protein
MKLKSCFKKYFIHKEFISLRDSNFIWTIFQFKLYWWNMRKNVMQCLSTADQQLICMHNTWPQRLYTYRDWTLYTVKRSTSFHPCLFLSACWKQTLRSVNVMYQIWWQWKQHHRHTTVRRAPNILFLSLTFSVRRKQYTVLWMIRQTPIDWLENKQNNLLSM